MRWIKIRPLLGTLLVIGGLWPALSSWQAEAAPTATVSACTITPRSGGPGTVVHVELSQWFDSERPVAVGFAVPKTAAELQGQPFVPHYSGSLKLLDKPLASLPATNSRGYAEATFKLPAQLPSGQPIPTQNLYLVCLRNGQVDTGQDWDILAFTFIPSPLPATGYGLLGWWLTLMLSGGVCVIAGSRIVRQQAGAVRGATRATPPRHTPPPTPLWYADQQTIGDRTVRPRLISSSHPHHEHHHRDDGLWHGREDARDRK